MKIKTMICGVGMVAALAFGAAALRAQAPAAPAPAAAAPDFSKVEITTTQLGPNVYGLDGQGGRMAVLVGPDGVFVVDSQFAPLTEKLVAAIRKVSPSPIRFLVNTHVHPDHTGGNENFGKMGVTILAREQLRNRLARPPAPAGGAAPAAAPTVALPILTYDSRLSLHMNGEDLQLIPLPAAHTDGDTAVFFPRANVLMTGDVFRSLGFPNIDRNNGGSLKGILAGMDTLIATAGPETKVAPGHGDVTNRAALVTHREMIVTIRDRVAKLMQEGKTAEQAVAAKPTADYDAKVGNAAMSADRFVQQLYAELKAAGTQ